ncbi:PREDICTED: WPP domain-containing protein 2-like [Camelina sativa]|uniref:WPP domain-containing protein 2-like n=1 Tax=Camelina sativa TaxID=90675 RepID=A0ABM0VV33_CAMSA|nr:PREDICTED: WPP domain-containing protein 2-like [Camelina sativa]
MAETADTINTTTSPPQSESDGSSTLSAMADPTSQEAASKDTDLTTKGSESEKKPGGISLRIWPPTQRTRDAVLNRLIETLSTESILSKRYGTVKSDEAATVAKSIEEEAYGVASNAVSGDDDGVKILELYSKEISKRMLESVKARSDNASSVGNGTESVEDASEVSKGDAPSVSEEEKSEA